MSDPTATAAWDAEYRAGRYRDEPPVAFTGDILAAGRQAGTTSGLYIGCGNGRNYLPLVAGGLDLSAGEERLSAGEPVAGGGEFLSGAPVAGGEAVPGRPRGCRAGQPVTDHGLRRAHDRVQGGAARGPPL